ncbi:MAG: chemotaxis protein CheW [Balneolales bacterium]|nr:chemotaxis protein CheW [Balneolales bacterium]
MHTANSLEILKKRARKLAEPLRKEEPGERISVIRFLLYPETFAIEASCVHEVFSLRDLTSIPGTPAFVMGVINFRSTLVPVVNLKKLLGIHETGLTEMNKVLLLRDGSMEFGLLCDRILGSAFILQKDIRDAPATVSRLGSELIAGMADENTILLDGRTLLKSRQLIVDQ